jgi:hypothetical protein
MAEVVLASGSEKQKWITQHFKEYVRESGFMPYMGRDPSKIIVTKYELQEEAGKTINIPFIGKLSGDGVTGNQTLDGAEEELNNYNFPISVDWRRNAVRVPKSQSFKTEMNLLDAAKGGLRSWEAEKLRDDIIKALLSINLAGSAGANDTKVAWASASAANKNSWVVANSDRVLFGKLKSNYSATFATALGNLDTTDDKCTSASMGLLRRIARSASPKLRPFRTETGKELYIAFHGARTFRDLSADSEITQANREARAREGAGMDKNPIFQDGDILYKAVLHVEIPEIDDLCTSLGGFDGQGASSADVRPVFMCGSAAVGIAWGQEPTPKTDYDKDYGFRPGVAIEELLGVEKVSYNGKMNGVAVGFFCAAADS